MSNHFDVIVIGAGAAGSAAAWQLAKDGRRTLLLEQFSIGHSRGSSHGESRIFRFAYPQATYAKFAMQSKPLWLQLEKDSGQRLLHSIGGLDFADDPECFKEVRDVASALAKNSARFEELTAAEIRKRIPPFRVPDQTIGVFSPDSGWIEAGNAVRAMAQQCAAHHGTVRENEPVLNIDSVPGHIRVRTAQATYEAGSLVIAAGAWVNHILAHLNLSLPVKITQEQPVYFEPVANVDSLRPPGFPIWIHYRRPFFTYGFPMLEHGFKLALHHDGPVINPASPDRASNPEVSRRLHEYLQTYIPDAAGPVLEQVTCLYTTTPDHDFIIDLLPNFPNIAIASPCSGHGFKFATGIGRALADLIQFGKTDLEISHTRYFNTKRPSNNVTR